MLLLQPDVRDVVVDQPLKKRNLQVEVRRQLVYGRAWL